jgi:hypothetical protein
VETARWYADRSGTVVETLGPRRAGSYDYVALLLTKL